LRPQGTDNLFYQCDESYLTLSALNNLPGLSHLEIQNQGINFSIGLKVKLNRKLKQKGYSPVHIPVFCFVYGDYEKIRIYIW
jgi:hypothetical protein